MKIEFSPPDISEDDINAVVQVLKSGWITSGAVCDEFSLHLNNYLNARYTLLLNSATSGLFLALKAYGIGPGDEVITTPYTFAATANAINHTGAKVVFADVCKNNFFIDPESIAQKITKNTKAIIPVDFGGALPDYQKINALARTQKIHPVNSYQEALGRILVLADSAHSLGALDQGRHDFADMRVFSFHAVKNLTTSEGGALSLYSLGDAQINNDFYSVLKAYALHGQDRSAREKFLNGAWEYDIRIPGYKMNMPDMTAALGLSQFRRYETDILPKRRQIFTAYVEHFKNNQQFLLPKFGSDHAAHLFPLRIDGFDESRRNQLIRYCVDAGISVNVHYKPLNLMSAASFYDTKAACPNAVSVYQNEISLPLHTRLTLEMIDYISATVQEGICI